MRRIDPDAEAARLAGERKRATEAGESGAAAKLAALRAAVQQVLDDEESQHPGGWGPDITMVGVLREAMEATGP